MPTSSPILISQSESTITVEMPVLSGSDTGSSPILSYNLKYYIGSNNSTLVEVVGGTQDSLLRVVS